jgi:RecA/RadA recombinase
MSLLEKLSKNSTIKEASVLSKSKFFTEHEAIPTVVPALNIALSAKLDEGIEAGLTQWCGESKRFKSTFCLLMAKTYLDKYPEAILLFYDSEFGTPQSYFEKIGIDMNRVLHVPIPNIEILKNDIVKQLDNIERGDKLFIIVDSIGNLASKKEVDDALNDKSVQDMSRPKQLKSLFRMITPYLNIKNIPMHVVNHTYKTLELYAKDIVSGGQGRYLSADNIYIIGRQQEIYYKC